MACIRICDQTIYNRNLNYNQALNYIQSQSYLLASDFDEEFRVRQGQAFEAIDNFEENIANQFEKYGNIQGVPPILWSAVFLIGSAKHAPIWDIFSVLKPSNIDLRLGEKIFWKFSKTKKNF